MSESELFTRMWTRAQPAVTSFVATMVEDFHDVDDIVQNVAVVLMRKFSEYDRDRPFTAWAIGMARNEILSSRRAYARSFLCIDSDLTDRVARTYEEMNAELEYRSHALRKCLEHVRGRPRQMLDLRYAESMAPREIARRLGLAAPSVRVALSKARALLRSCVERKLAASGGPL